MKFFQPSDDRTYTKVRRRLDSVSLPQTQDWAATTLWTIQEGLEQAHDRAALEQARTGTVALLAAVDSLLDRSD
jgi:hypothetical protein